MRSSLVSKLRKTLLPPESGRELFLRTLYHRINATPFFINRQIRKAASSYTLWRQAQNRVAIDPVANIDTLPFTTFLMQVEAGSEKAALMTIRSLQAQAISRWQIVPVLKGRANWAEFSAQFTPEDQISSAISLEQVDSNYLNELGTGFVVFCRAGDVFSNTTLNEFASAVTTSPSVDVIYSDTEYVQDGTADPAPFFKPAAVSPELMLSHNYLSRAFIRRGVLANLSMTLDPPSDLLSLEYDLLLQLVNKQAVHRHIPRVLVTLSHRDLDGEDSVKEVLTAHFEQQGLNRVVVNRVGEHVKVNWDFGNPTVSLIILNHNHGDWLRSLVDSIFKLTDYENFTVTIVDNLSNEPDVLAYYNELAGDARVRVVHYDHPFNYSEAINIGVAHSSGDVVVLLNNDMQVTDPRWLHELVQWAVHPGIGVVGGKLLHRNRTIQHAGIILGMNGFIGHLYLNAPEHYHGLAGSVDWYRNFYALTGACQAIRRDLFNEVGGYDERFRLAFGDIDFCLRVVKAGYRNVYNPFAGLIHFEGGSRGYETPVKDIILGYEELLPWLEKEDPYFSPNLTYEPIPRCNIQEGGVDERLANIENRKQALRSNPSS